MVPGEIKPAREITINEGKINNIKSCKYGDRAIQGISLSFEVNKH